MSQRIMGIDRKRNWLQSTYSISYLWRRIHGLFFGEKPLDYRITDKNENGVVILAIEGALNIYHVSKIQSSLLGFLAGADRVILELGAVNVLDGAGVQLLVFLKREARRQGKPLDLRDHSPTVLNALDLLGLAGYFGDPLNLTAEQQEQFPFAYGTEEHPEVAAALS